MWVCVHRSVKIMFNCYCGTIKHGIAYNICCLLPCSWSEWTLINLRIFLTSSIIKWKKKLIYAKWIQNNFFLLLLLCIHFIHILKMQVLLWWSFDNYYTQEKNNNKCLTFSFSSSLFLLKYLKIKSQWGSSSSMYV